MSSPSNSSSMALVDQMSVTVRTQDAEEGLEDVYDEDHEGHYESQAEGRDQSPEECQDDLREYPGEEDHDEELYEDQGHDEDAERNCVSDETCHDKGHDHAFNEIEDGHREPIIEDHDENLENAERDGSPHHHHVLDVDEAEEASGNVHTVEHDVDEEHHDASQDPEDTLNESRSSGAALDTEFLYCCMLCGESYGCQEDLKRHKELVHQQPNCDNETADETDDDGNGVDERKGIGGGDKPFDPMDYLEVEVEAGDEVGEDSQEEGTDKPLYTCRVCGKAFKGRRCLLKHEAQHWGDMGNNYDQEDLAEDDSNSGQANDRPSYQCRMCGKEFKGKKCLLKHEAQHLNDLGLANAEKLGQMGPPLASVEAGQQEDSQYRCRMCAKGFKSKKCLLKHEAAHLTDLGMAGDPIAQDESQYRCRLCGKGFKSKKCHLKHEAQHLTDLGVAGESRVPSTAQGQADGFFQCRLCGKSFKGQSWLLRHEAQHLSQLTDQSRGGPQPATINVDHTNNRSFEEMDEDSHPGTAAVVDISSEVRPYQCRGCRKKFKGKKWAMKCCGMDEVDQIDEDGGLVEDNSLDRPYQCRGCRRKFKGRKWAQKCCGMDEVDQIDEDGALVEENSPDRPYGCRGCGKKFKGKRWAQKCCGIDDIDQPEDESAPVFDSTLDKPYICRTCGKGFKGRKWAQKCCNSSESAGHDSSLTETEPYEHLPDPQVYLDDSLTEVEDQAYSPPLAKRMKMGGMSNDNQAFSTPISKRIKMEGMTIEESPLPASGGIECEVCHKVLPYKSMYERHLRKHTGERPYQCSEEGCDRAFKESSNLNAHMRNAHSGVKTFFCSECPKSFYHRALLEQHEKSHQGKSASKSASEAPKPFQCQTCYEGFTNLNGLLKHQGSCVQFVSCEEVRPPFIPPEPARSSPQLNFHFKPLQADQSTGGMTKSPMPSNSGHRPSQEATSSPIVKIENADSTPIVKLEKPDVEEEEEMPHHPYQV